jgi:FkbM family methyltransferase
MLKKIFYLKEQLKIIKRINSTLINIVESSIVNENISIIQLSNGRLFTGEQAKKHHRRLHFLLKKQLRKKIPATLMKVLFDIDFRYMNREDHFLDLEEGKYLKLREGDIVFEVGAYIGYHSMRLSELVGNTGKIVAIEAIPSNYDIMKKNIELNNLNNIIPINIAIWKNKGNISMNVDEDQKNSIAKNIINTKNVVGMPCNTIDNIFHELNLTKVDFIRIQTNGAEIEALEGMNKVFEHKPKLLVAVPYKNKDFIQKYLKSKGYVTKFTGHSILAEWKN